MNKSARRDRDTGKKVGEEGSWFSDRCSSGDHQYDKFPKVTKVFHFRPHVVHLNFILSSNKNMTLKRIDEQNAPSARVWENFENCLQIAP